MPSSRKTAIQWVIVLALVIGLGHYFLKHFGISHEEISQSLKRFDSKTLFLGVFLVLLQNLFMSLRTWALFPHNQKIPLKRALHGVFYGQSMNMFIPARAGDVLKVMTFSKGGTPPVTTSAGVILTDKAIDLVALLCLIFWSGSFFVIRDSFSFSINPKMVAVGALVIGALVFILRFFLKSNLHKLSKWWLGLKTGLLGVLDWQNASLSLLMGVFAWACEACLLQTLCEAQGFPLLFRQAIFVLTLLNVAIAVPVSIANVGPFEAALIFALGKLGMSTAMGLSVAGVHHLLQMITLLGATGLIALFRASTFKQDNAGALFLVKPDDKKKAHDYFQSVSQNYEETVGKGLLKTFRTRERAKVLELAQLDQPSLSLLDVGCGSGFYSLEAKKRGLTVHSVDLSEGMIHRLAPFVDKAEVRDIESLSLNQQYDRVICAGVLDFVEDPQSAFSNLCKLVSPSGRLVVLCPRKGLGGFYYRCEKYFFGMKVNLFSETWLSSEAARHGLNLIQVLYPLPTNMALLFTKK